MTDSTKTLIAAVEVAGEEVKNKNSLIIPYDEGDEIANIYHDGMMYGNGRIALNTIDEEELKADGVKIWRAWNYK